MDRNEAIEHLKVVLKTCDVQDEEAVEMAIAALIDKDIDVPSKEEAIPVDWLDSYITNHSHGEIVFESIGMMYIRAMIEQWRKEQNGKTD